MGPILSLILRRLALSGVILVLVSAVVFVGTEILPGDALDATIPADELIYYTEEDLDRMRTELGLNKPLFERFGIVLWNLVTFDFGVTILTQERVIDFIYADRLPRTGSEHSPRSVAAEPRGRGLSLSHIS